MLQDASPATTSTASALTSRSAESSANEWPGEWRVVALSSLGHALCHTGELAITGALLAIQRQFQLDQRLVTSLPYLGYVLLGVGAIPTGLAVDRWGADRLLRWYYFSLAIAAVAVAVASNVGSLFLGLTLLGMVLSVYHPAGTALISVGIRRREWAMGVNGVAGSIGVACGPLLGGLWAGSGYWQGAFWTLAAVSFLAGCSMWRLRWQPHDPLPSPVATAAPPAADSRKATWLVLAPLYLAMMLGGLNYRTLVTALPIYLTGDASAGQALARGGLYSFAALLAGTIGQYGSGVLAQRRGAMPIYSAAIVLMSILAACLALIAEPTLGLAVAILLAVCLFAQQPVENSLLAEGSSAQRRGLSYGMKFALTFGVGALGAPVVGLVWHYTNQPRAAFWLLTASGLTMTTALIIFRVLRRAYFLQQR